MTAVLLTVVAASLVGSLHCAGMCGGLVAFYAGTDASRGMRRLLSHAAYNGGRLIGYLVLGAAAGAIGAALDIAGSLAGLQRVAMRAAGVLMIAWGVGALLQLRGFRVLRLAGDGAIGRRLRRALAVATRRPPVARGAAVGLLTALLPCGWLWAFVVTAAGTGSAPAGVAVMAAFWVGTVPILLAVGLGVQVASIPFRRFAPSLTAVILVVLGVFAVVGRPLTSAAAMARHRAKSAAGAADPVGQLDRQDLPRHNRE